MINYSFVQTIRFDKFKRNTLKPPGQLNNRFILFQPVVDKYTEFYQTGQLRVNQISTIFPSFLQNHNIKKTKLEWLKLDHSICDTENYFLKKKI